MKRSQTYAGCRRGGKADRQQDLSYTKESGALGFDGRFKAAQGREDMLEAVG